MRIIISPAKKMNRDESLPWRDKPVFLEKTQILMEYLKGLSYGEARDLWKCNDSLAELNYCRVKEMDLHRGLTPAILSYEGIQYQYMAPAVFADKAVVYVQENLRILSGFYGVLKPLDGIVPYRLEMQAKAKAAGAKDLYAYWGDALYREVTSGGEHLILNLASKEYSKCIEKYLTDEDIFLTVVFGEISKGKVVQRATAAKMARGEMVRFLAENEVQDMEGIKSFEGLGYRFREELSSEKEYVFLKE